MLNEFYAVNNTPLHHPYLIIGGNDLINQPTLFFICDAAHLFTEAGLFTGSSWYSKGWGGVGCLAKLVVVYRVKCCFQYVQSVGIVTNIV